MKTKKMTYLARTLVLGMLATLMVFTINSCTKKAHFLQSSVVPAAEGDVKIKRDRNDNYVLKMEIKNLAEIDRLQPPKNHYVVWMETDRGTTRNVGLITSSSRHKVSFETVSTLKPTRIFITAEDDGDVQYPGSMVVLTTERL